MVTAFSSSATIFWSFIQRGWAGQLRLKGQPAPLGTQRFNARGPSTASITWSTVIREAGRAKATPPFLPRRLWRSPALTRLRAILARYADGAALRWAMSPIREEGFRARSRTIRKA